MQVQMCTVVEISQLNIILSNFDGEKNKMNPPDKLFEHFINTQLPVLMVMKQATQLVTAA
jgi:hypothetical protein